MLLVIISLGSIVAAWCGNAAAGEIPMLNAAGALDIQPRRSTMMDTGNNLLAVPDIVVGDPGGIPPVVPADRVDANVSTSAFTGVVSLFMDFPPVDGSGGICTGTVISPNHILTAAHCVDINGGVGPGSSVTGDGIIDVAPVDVRVVFNHTGSNAAQRTVAAIDVHPDWHGFNNSGGPEGASINDDLAVLRLSSPIPAGVAVYPLGDTSFDLVEQFIQVGYGQSGDGVGGFSLGPDFHVKRTGQNLASVFGLDDEAPGTAKERYLFDFDGPDLTTDTFNDGGTLGNFFETTGGGGDSGGPTFLWDDANADLIPQDDELTLFGVHTHSRGGGGIPASPLFGSQGGGMLVSTYKPFIEGVLIPEPGSLLLAAIGLAGVLVLARQRLLRLQGGVSRRRSSSHTVLDRRQESPPTSGRCDQILAESRKPH